MPLCPRMGGLKGIGVEQIQVFEVFKVRYFERAETHVTDSTALLLRLLSPSIYLSSLLAAALSNPPNFSFTIAWVTQPVVVPYCPRELLRCSNRHYYPRFHLFTYYLAPLL